MKRWLSALLTVIICSVVLSGCASRDASFDSSADGSHTSAAEGDATITKEEYERLEQGMSYQEVVQIIGGEGTVISQTGSQGEDFYTTMYQWPGEGDKMSSANILFQADKLLSKSEYGLQ